MNARLDFTGIAYLIAIGLAVTMAVIVYRQGGKFAASAKDAANAINPTNPNNIFARGANAIVQVVSGDSATSVGSKLFDLVHPNEGAELIAPTPVKKPAPATVDLGMYQDRGYTNPNPFDLLQGGQASAASIF